MRVLWKLFIALLKILSRQREAVLWSVLLPLFMILLFSFVSFNGMGSVSVGVVNEADTAAAHVIRQLQAVATLEVALGGREDELAALRKGDRDVVLVLPRGFHEGETSEVMSFVNDAKPQEAQLGVLLIQRALDEITFSRNGTPGRILLRSEKVQSRNLTYFDFVAPGILAMSIMQLGIFGVAFGFVSLKKRGILRRLFVTPIRRSDFIIASVAVRLVLVMIQIVIMTLVPYFFLDLHFVGSLWELFAVGLVGAVVFLALGFAIAGVGKSEDQVAPLANVIAIPMMVLSGVFFSRNSLPDFVRSVVDYLPLSFLADAMRFIAVDGASLIQVLPQIVGLAVWSIISIVIAVRLFKWE